MDGNYVSRLRINKADSLLSLKAAKPGKHTVRIYKATEAHTGPIFIQKIEAPKITAIKPASAPLIEFIGNSITCGAAADLSEVPCGQGLYHDQHNAYYAYGPRLARALSVNFLLSSVSGIGIYRNWNSDGPDMPDVYDKTDFQEDGQRSWDFKKYKPAVVSIALGTNDLSNGDGTKPRRPFDSSKYVNDYVKFIQQVRSEYGDVQIILLSSPMINGERKILLQNCLATIKKNSDLLDPSAKPVALYFFKPMQAKGCTGHPSVEDHAVMAAELLPVFRKLLSEN
jgi:lysophospholipase L1-like esterase